MTERKPSGMGVAPEEPRASIVDSGWSSRPAPPEADSTSGTRQTAPPVGPPLNGESGGATNAMDAAAERFTGESETSQVVRRPEEYAEPAPQTAVPEQVAGNAAPGAEVEAAKMQKPSAPDVPGVQAEPPVPPLKVPGVQAVPPVPPPNSTPERESTRETSPGMQVQQTHEPYRPGATRPRQTLHGVAPQAGTLLGVAPPSVGNNIEFSRAPTPVAVRAGTVSPDEVAPPVVSARGSAPSAPGLAPMPTPPSAAASAVETAAIGSAGNAPQMTPELQPQRAPEVAVSPSVGQARPIHTTNTTPLSVDEHGAVGALAALSTRVRFAGGDVPLWALITPLVTLLVLVVAIAALALGARRAPVAVENLRSPGAVAPLTPPPPVAEKQAAPGKDVKALEAKAPETLTSAELITLSQSRTFADLSAVKQIADKLGRDPNLIKDGAILRDLRDFSQKPHTGRDVLSILAALPGPISADLIYEVWTGTSGRNEITELAQKLMYTSDIRAKASPALTIALDLRAAETCEQNLDAVTRAVKDADRRSLHLLTKLKRKQGCGPKKREDCYECLREGTLLDDAIKSAKARKDPPGFPPPAK